MNDTATIEQEIEDALGTDSELPEVPDQIQQQMSKLNVTDAGYTIVYDQISGRPSNVNNNWLRATLKVLRLNENTGKLERAFRLKPPKEMPPPPSYPGWFHPDSPEHSTYRKMGIKPCKKMLISEFDAEQHTRNKHRRQYDTVKDMLDREEKKEDRAFRKMMMERMSAAAAPPAPMQVIESQADLDALPDIVATEEKRVPYVSDKDREATESKEKTSKKR